MQLFERKKMHFLKICTVLLSLPAYSKDMLKEGKQERTVIHLEVDGNHYYYGNLKALCDNWSKEDIGVSYNYLRNYGIAEEKIFVGKKCIIRKGIIVTSPHKATE